MESNKKGKSIKERILSAKRSQKIRFAIVSVLFFAFLTWLGNWWFLLVYPVLVDIYLTRYVRWDWWRTSKSSVVRTVMSLDRRYCLCPCACIYNFHIHWSELQDSVFFIGENASCGRLSVGQQDVLRAACAYHSNPLSSLSEHVSYNQHKEPISTIRKTNTVV